MDIFNGFSLEKKLKKKFLEEVEKDKCISNVIKN